MKYQVEITGWGQSAMDFLSPDVNLMILFDDTAPAELLDIALVHKVGQVNEEPVVGDTLRICDKEYTITAVGSEAFNTLKEMGHCTLSFSGKSQAQRPGIIELEGPEMRPEDFFVGGMIEIE